MAKPYGLANQKLWYIQMFLAIEKSGEEDKERSQKWFVNTDPDYVLVVYRPFSFLCSCVFFQGLVENRKYSYQMVKSVIETKEKNMQEREKNNA